MRSSLEIQQEIDKLAIEAKALYESCMANNREMNEEEAKRFDDITDKKSGLIAKLEKEKIEAVDKEDRMAKIAMTQARERRANELGAILDDDSRTRRAILPVSGRLQEAERQSQPTLRIAKLKAFKDERTAYDSGMWLRAIVNRDDLAAREHCHKLGWKITATATEGTGSTGGYLVPSPLSQTIIDVRERVGVMRQLLRVMPMTADTMSVTKRSGGLTVYGPQEAGAITASDKSWTQIELVTKKRAVAHQISQELVDDALISVVDDAVGEMAFALAQAEDAEAVNGDGTSSYRGVAGLKNNIGTAGVQAADTGEDTWPELDINDFTNAMGKLPEKFGNGELSWLCSSNFYWTVMLRVLTEAGGNAVVDLQAGDGGRRMFLGYPVFMTNQMPTATAANTICAYFGNFRELGILGDRMGVMVARSTDYAFLNDLLTIKATARYDIQLHELGDTTNAGAVVALKTAS